MQSDRRLRPPQRRHGLITTQAALSAGYDARDIRQMVRSGAWVQVRRGVFADRELWESADIWTGRPLLVARAAHISMELEHVMSHDSAALELGIPLITPPTLVHVTRPDVHGSRHERGVKHHGAAFFSDQVRTPGGIPCLDPARTAVDLAREHGYPAGLVACDAVLRQGDTRDELERALAPMRSWPGVRSARASVADADPRAENAAESLGREFVEELGLGPVWPQFPLLLPDGRIVELDLVVGRHAFEVDGLTKYLTEQAGGVAAKEVAQVVMDEKRRERQIGQQRMGVSRVFWSDFFGAERARATARARAEFAHTVQRFGTRLPDDVLRFAEQHRDRWRRRL